MSRATRSPGAVLVGASAAQASVALVNFGLPAIGPQLQRRVRHESLLARSRAGGRAARLGDRAHRCGHRRRPAGSPPRDADRERDRDGGPRRGSLRPEHRSPLRGAPRVRPGIRRRPGGRCRGVVRAYPATRRGWALGVRQTAVPLGGTIAAVTFPGLFALGGLELAMLGSAAAVAGTGVVFAVVSGDDRRPAASRIGRPFRTILAAPGLRRLLAVAACYIVVLQALLDVHRARRARSGPLGADRGRRLLRDQRRRDGGPYRLGEDRRPGWRLAARAHARRGRARGRRSELSPSPARCTRPQPLVVAAAVVFGLGALGWNALVYLSAGERVDAGARRAARSRSQRPSSSSSRAS